MERNPREYRGFTVQPLLERIRSTLSYIHCALHVNNMCNILYDCTSEIVLICAVKFAEVRGENCMHGK